MEEKPRQPDPSERPPRSVNGWLSVLVTAFLDPAKAWHLFQARMGKMKGGGIIITVIGLGIIGFEIWGWFRQPLIAPSNVANNNNNSNVIQGSPGASINNNIAPKMGLRLLHTGYEVGGDKVVTTLAYGSQMLESTGRYSIALVFAKPYETSEASFKNLTNIITNGGFDGRPPQVNSNQFIISGAGIGQAWLVLKFTAPYKMQLLSEDINPPPEN